MAPSDMRALRWGAGSALSSRTGLPVAAGAMGD